MNNAHALRVVCAALVFFTGVHCSTGQATTAPASTQPAKSVSVQDFGAVGDGKAKDTTAFQAAINSGRDVIVPKGKYLIGSIKLHSNATLWIESGATLIGSPDIADYPLRTVRFEGEDVPGHSALISADGATNIAIEGPGSIVGDQTVGNLRKPRGPLLVEFVDCANVHLNGLTERYRRLWTNHLLRCQNVTLSHLYIRSTQSNGDGIDVDSSQNVTIDHCDIDTGDDCVSLKSGRGLIAFNAKQATKRVAITDCTLGSHFAGVGIGTEMSGGIDDVTIQRCNFTHGDNSIFFKSNNNRGAAISNVSASDLTSSTTTFIGLSMMQEGIIGSQPVTGLDGVSQLLNIKITRAKVRVGTLLDGEDIDPRKHGVGFVFSNITGTCDRAITLSDMDQVDIENIHVTGYNGPLMTLYQVSGKGVEGAAQGKMPTMHPRRRPSTRPRQQSNSQ